MDQHTVIVLASDLMTRQRVVSQLAAAGYAATGVASQERFTEGLGGEPPAAVVVEFDDPRINAAALITSLRGDERWTSVPIVAYGAHTRTDAMDDARKAGATAVVARGQMMRRASGIVDEVITDSEGTATG